MKTLILTCLLAWNLPLLAQKTWTLQQCIDYAMEHNISIRRQQQTVAGSEIDLNTSRNNRLPTLNASATQSLNFGRGLTAENTYANRNTQNTNLDLNASVALYSGGQLSRDIEIKQLNLQASLADLSVARENIQIQVITAFMEALYQQELVTIAEGQLRLSHTQAQRITQLVANGKAAPSDEAEAQATVASDELQLVQAENSYSLAILNLTQLLEVDSPEGFQITFDPEKDAPAGILPDADEIFSQALGIKPQVKAEQYRLESAQKNIALARSGYYPTVSLGGGLGSSYYKVSGYPSSGFSRQLSDNLNKYIGLSVSIPVFNRHQTRNQIKRAKAEEINRQLVLDQTKKDLYKEIQQAYYNARAAQRQLLSSEAAEKAAQQAYTLIQRKYEIGKATATEYEEAKTRLVRSQNDRAQASCTFSFRKLLLEFYQKNPAE